MARRLGASEFGIFSLAKAIPALAFQATSLGLDVFLKRELAKDRDLTEIYLGNTLSIRIGASIITLFLVILFSFTIDYEPAVRWAILIGSVGYIFESISNVAIAVYQGHEKMQYQVVIELFKSLMSLVLGYFLLNIGYGVIEVLLLLLLLSIIKSILGLVIISFKLGSISLKFDFDVWRYMVFESLPWVFVMLFMTANYRLDSVILSILGGERDVGLYNAAYTILMGLAFIPNSMTAALFPNLSQSYSISASEVRHRFNKIIIVMLIVGLVVSLPLFLSARPIMNFIYSKAYLDAVPAFRFLMLTLFMMFLSGTCGIALNAVNMQRSLLAIVALSAIVNVSLNLVLIPRLGYTGSAITAFITETIIGFLGYGILRRRLRNS
jgi:O-antigen/teichoic acid export membrane protein